MTEYPTWALELVAALEEHEDTHSADTDPHTCVKAILDEIPAEVRTYAAGWAAGKRRAEQERPTFADGGVITSKKFLRVGEHDIRVVVDPTMPPDLLLAVGKCICGHPAMGHNEDGCFTPGAKTGARCPCATPVSRLIAGTKIAPESSDG